MCGCVIERIGVWVCDRERELVCVCVIERRLLAFLLRRKHV